MGGIEVVPEVRRHVANTSCSFGAVAVGTASVFRGARGEAPGPLEAIVSNDDNLYHGRTVSVHIGPEDYITALTDDCIDGLRDILASERVSIEEWHSFLDEFVAEPDIIARVKNKLLREKPGAC